MVKSIGKSDRETIKTIRQMIRDSWDQVEWYLSKQADNPNDEKNKRLPEFQTQLSSDEIRRRLLSLSKKGKLPGYSSESDMGIASVAAHGAPFDSKLEIIHDSEKVTFEAHLLKLIPTIFAITLVVTIWPGLPLTDGFLRSFVWYDNLMGKIGIETWHWYLPLTILPAPFMFKSAIAKSKLAAHESALETIEKIRAILQD